MAWGTLPTSIAAAANSPSKRCKFYTGQRRPPNCLHSNATRTSHVNSIPPSSQMPSLKRTISVNSRQISPSSIDLTLEFSVAVSSYPWCRQCYQLLRCQGENIHHNPTIAIAPGDLSTISWPFTFVRLAGYPPHTSVYDPAACRTYGLDNGTIPSCSNDRSDWTTSVSYKMGPPYDPIVLPLE